MPQTLRGIYENGEYSEAFPVNWDIPENAFAAEGIVTINGTANILDSVQNVKATIRVEPGVAESTNIASKNNVDAPVFTNGRMQNGVASEPSTTAISDSLLKLNDGITNNSSDTNARWTNWAIRDESPAVDTYVQLEWQNEYKMQNVKLWHFTDSAYTVVNVCVLEDNDRVTGTRLEQILSKLSSHIRCNYNGILCCAQDKQILLVLCDYSDEACRKTTERIFQILCRMVCQKEQIFVSVSKQISGIRQIYKSYQFAEKMSDLLCVCQVPGEQSTDGGKIIFYKDLGIYRVLLTLTDKEAIKEYLADTVAPLYEYDEMNHSDLVRVLQCYLANDCSVKSASQELIVHRNTINYKLGKAAEILGKNLSDFDVRFQLRLGFLLYQMNEM